MKWIVPAVLLLITMSGQAQELPEIDTDRPDQTESSSVLPGSTLQIEAGVHSEGGNLEQTYSIPAVLLRYGLLEWLELRAIGEYWTYRSEGVLIRQPPMPTSGTNIGGGIKLQLTRENGALPEIAFLAHVTKSSGTGDSGSSDPVPDFRFSMGHSLPGDLSLGYNLGGEWISATEKLVGVYTIALGFPIGSEFGGYVEFFGDYDESVSISFDAGATYAVQNNLQLDVSAGTGITRGAPDHYFGVGLSVRIPE
jgi:hypothetical protein